MQKRSSTLSKGRARVVSRANKSTGASDPSAQDPLPAKNPAAVALGRLGGLKGGRARAEKLSAKQRSRIASKAAEARWKNSTR